MNGRSIARGLTCLTLVFAAWGCSKSKEATVASGPADADLDNLVRRSYQYVAMYNVNNKFALKMGGWNTLDADTALKDHTMREIARPNNDSLYISALVDLRAEPMVLDVPVFGSDYTSLMITGYDHYVNVPMTTRVGDFAKPEKMLLYSARTAGYDGAPVEGIDRTFEATGDFVSAVFRVMPHANEPERFAKIVERMKGVRLLSLSELRGGEHQPPETVAMPPVGKTDLDVFENDFLDVMQFVCDHTTFDPNDSVDQGFLAALAPFGVAPGAAPDPAKRAALDGQRLRAVAERVVAGEMAKTHDPSFIAANSLSLFRTKGNMTPELLLYQSVLGPIGLPATEAVYPPILTVDGEPMNAQNDYVIRMASDALPPATAFWSVTLYDTANGYFLPNDRKKYSVGKNAGMKLDADGGIAIYIAAEKPEGVPEENWLPVNRGDYAIDAILRIYVPDLERYATWQTPKAEKI